MKLQQIFNKILKGLQGQKWKKAMCADSETYTGCVYFGDNGSRCAVGHLLPDKHEFRVREYYNNAPVDELVDCIDDIPDVLNNIEFMGRMQTFHDDYMATGSDGKLTPDASDDLECAAQQYGVKVPDFVKKDLYPRP